MTNDDFNTFLSKYQREEAVRAQAASSQFAQQVVPELVKLGISTIDVQYSGYGDSGGAENAECHDAEGKGVQLPQELQRGVFTYAESLLPPGFEINDGGQGVVKLDIVRGTFKLHHETNFTETETTESEGQF
jgi:hypothetical protein